MSQQPRVMAKGATTLRVLLIGNSYTNHMQRWFVRFFKADPEFGLMLQSKTPGGRQLRQHAEDAPTMAQLEDHPWDAVVLQDQSVTACGACLNYTRSGSGLPFHEWAAKQVARPEHDEDDPRFWDGLGEAFWSGGSAITQRALKHEDATVYYFVPWARHRDEWQPERRGVLKRFSGQSAQEAVRAMSRANESAYAGLHGAFPDRSALIYVNRAWDAHYAAHPDRRLHQGDHSHANQLGSQIAAAMIFQGITGKPLDQLIFPEVIGEEDAQLIRAAMRAALKR